MASFRTIYESSPIGGAIVQEFSELSYRMLDDIGVGRNDIEHIVRHTLVAEAAPSLGLA